jgi:hypothetical protein
VGNQKCHSTRAGSNLFALVGMKDIGGTVRTRELAQFALKGPPIFPAAANYTCRSVVVVNAK